MKILVLGGSGMLGHKLVQVLGRKHDVRTTVRGTSDEYPPFTDPGRMYSGIDALGDPARLREVFEEFRPELVLNAVGVIKQRKEAADPVRTIGINSLFPHRAAELSAENGARFVTFSTDCVFSGREGNYTEEDTPDASDLYGRSKLLGEVTGEGCLTVRTSIIGRELRGGESLLEWFLSNRGGRVKGFRNVIYSGFPTISLAGIISDLLDRDRLPEGLWHLSSEPVSKYELLRLVRAEWDLDIEIEPSDEPRLDRSLDSDRFRRETGFEPPAWPELVRDMCRDATPYEAWRERTGKTGA